jgi:hypothetical protein
MTAATLRVPLEPPAVERPAGVSDRLIKVVLVRLAAGDGATRSALVPDLAAMAPQRLPLAQWRVLLDAAIEALLKDGAALETAQRLRPSEAGAAAVRRFLGVKGGALPRAWSDLRDGRLIAKALGLERLAAKDLKALARRDGLSAAVVQAAYPLKIKGIASPSRLRAALAGLALQRAFNHQLSAGLAGNGGLSAKAGRLLAGQLARLPRDFGTDTRLIATLAAEQLGAKQADLDSLRRAVLARFLEAALPEADAGLRPPPRVAAKGSPPAPARPSPAVVVGRPDLAGFVSEVRRHVGACAEGWVGNRKAYISHVWRAFNLARRDWGLSEIEFKCMLLEAHRAGKLALANADLKDHNRIKDLQESAVVYKNAIFHFVRVEG